MTSMLHFALAFLFQATTPPADRNPAAHNPTYSRDGRLAVSVQGDLWVVSKSGAWTRITSGGAWDREPAWSSDGQSIVFSSDRAGNFDLWTVSATGGAEPKQLTTSPLADAEPAVGRD